MCEAAPLKCRLENKENGYDVGHLKARLLGTDINTLTDLVFDWCRCCCLLFLLGAVTYQTGVRTSSLYPIGLVKHFHSSL